jgi:PilX N-terminal
MDAKQHHSKGFTLIATLLLLLLLSGVALGLMYMVNTEARVGGNDLENGLAYHAAEGGMEKMTADLANLFSSSQAPTAATIGALQAFPPTIQGVTYPEYTINVPTDPVTGAYLSHTDTISSGNNQGLIAQIIPMTLTVTAQRPLGDEVRMIRTVEVALIPVFQFGVFSDGDLSYFPGPPFTFAGRVHTNGNLFLADGNSLTLHDKVAAAGEVIREQLANGYPTSVNYTGAVYIPSAPGGCDVVAPGPSCLNLGLAQGSKVAGPTSANNTTVPAPSGWNTTVSNYHGYLLNGSAGANILSLPFVGAGVGPVQIIRRPAPGEVLGSTLSSSRLFNQAQIRIQISDDPAENHNGDVTKIDAQDIQLASQEPASLMAHRPADIGSAGTAQAGIAVQLAGTSYFGESKTTGAGPDGNFVPPATTYDGTSFASTGATEWPLVDGWLRVEIQKADGTWLPVTAEWLQLGFARGIQIPNTAAGVANAAHPRAILIFQQLADRDNNGVLNGADGTAVTGASSQYSWYPINFYDPREGEVRDTSQAGCAPNGVMNAVELDVWNLRQWLNGTFGGNGALTDNAKQNGYVLYFSDRRGMRFDANVAPPTKTGEYGFEDVINSAVALGTPDGLKENAEDVDGNGVLDNWGAYNVGEAFGAATTAATHANPPNPFAPRVACTTIARANRVTGARHVLRLINGTRGNLPTRAGYTGGFSVASENPVYILGDYNAALADHGWNDANHAAAAVMADAVTLLSNTWSDRIGFINPTAPGSRPGGETYYRLAIAGGKNINFAQPTTWGAANDYGTDGGVHNFLRYIEAWGAPLHYEGSLVSLYYAQYATGIFKCCTTVYSPPTRDYSFDTLFLNPANLPPGTPMFRDVDNTSFRQDFTPY